MDTKEEVLHLSRIRSTLIRQEETIIFALVERAQFKVNDKIYEKGAIEIQTSEPTSFLDYMLRQREEVDAKVRRFTAPDENAFFPANLHPPILPLLNFPVVIEPNAINLNDKIKNMYTSKIVHQLCVAGDDGQYGSSTINDIAILQALSKRIHYGKFVAESKFCSQTEKYTELIEAGDSKGIMELLTNSVVEAKILERVRRKARAYGSDYINEVGTAGDGQAESTGQLKVDPELIVSLYKEFIIPITKEVEVLYLLRRLGGQKVSSVRQTNQWLWQPPTYTCSPPSVVLVVLPSVLCCFFLFSLCLCSRVIGSQTSTSRAN